MSTASTRRARKRQRSAERRQANAQQPRTSYGLQDLLPGAPELGSEISERAWLVGSACVLIAAAALRLVALGLKPMHHDEGVNGFFLMNLMRQGVYHYDPANYHGPTLYFITLPLAYLADKLHVLDSWVLRLVTAAFGVGTVWLVLALRRRLGAVAALMGAALVAVSPACVFYSRYFIHEALFVFFTLGVVVAALRFYETGAATYLLLASASASLLFATKETAFISLGTLALAWLSAFVWSRLSGGGRGEPREGGLRGFVAEGFAPLWLAAAAALFACIWLTFYSSFFTYQHGIWDSFKAFDIWSKTGMSEFHEKPYYTYVKWLVEEESPVLLLACLGTWFALFERRQKRFAVFVCAWAFGLLAAYSIIKYKTPWLVLSFVVPMCVAGGYAVQALWNSGRAARRAALAIASAAVAVCLYQTVVLNFFKYDDDSYPYVYSHTRRGTLEMLREVDAVAARAGTKEPGVSVVSPEYWPLPWYFRDNPRVGYSGQISSYYDPQTTLVVIGRRSDNPTEDQSQRLRATLGAGYVEAGTYDLRPGVRLVLFERRDLAAR